MIIDKIILHKLKIWDTIFSFISGNWFYFILYFNSLYFLFWLHSLNFSMLFYHADLLLLTQGHTLDLARLQKLRAQFMHWTLRLLYLMMSFQQGKIWTCLYFTPTKSCGCPITRWKCCISCRLWLSVILICCKLALLQKTWKPKCLTFWGQLHEFFSTT